MDVKQFLAEKAARTEAALKACLAAWTDAPDRLVEAMAYSLFAGGKRLRPALALGAADMVRGDDQAAMPAACAIEMIHTYSLIHDDLPAMDDDDLRRGRPALHKVYGEATAILAGDALLTMAFDAAAGTGDALLVREIAQAAGVSGMVGGQQRDMESEGQEITLDELRRIHRCKTGALIRAAVRTGAMLAGASQEALDALTCYGEAAGLAFQIADDILDVTGSAEALGKSTGADAARGKVTWPALIGLEAAREHAAAAKEEALAALAVFGPEAEPFRKLALFIVGRDT
jgi:geranylgeranyl diphosphate synthase, type II